MKSEILVPTKRMIPTQIYSSSCVGISGTFPRGHGNYISTRNSKERFIIVNLSSEDLIDAIEMGLVNSTMEADVYPTQQFDEFVAYITDERLPSKAKEPLHWYNVPKECQVPIIRKRFSVPDSMCICEPLRSFFSAVFFHSTSRSKRQGTCRQCHSKYVITRDESQNESE